jgi:ornithine cyclodeaminase/alanine dehydrogenase-like protein (mu-crystallin family)
VLTLTYLNAPDVARLALTDDEILAAVEAGLRAQGEGRTVIEPRMHLAPGRDDRGTAIHGHFNVLRGYVAPLGLAGVKVVGDYVDNYAQGLPSEMGLLNLFDPATGRPLAVIDAAGLTDMRTGAPGVGRASALGRSVEVAVGGLDQARDGMGPVATCEGVDCGEVAGGVHLEYGPETARPSELGRSVEVAVGGLD